MFFACRLRTIIDSVRRTLAVLKVPIPCCNNTLELANAFSQNQASTTDKTDLHQNPPALNSLLPKVANVSSEDRRL